MLVRLEAWVAQMDDLPEAEAEFQRWLFLHAAGVLLGEKAGELLTLSAGQCGLSVDRQTRCAAALSASWRFSQRVLCRLDSRARVVLFDPARVAETLSGAPRWVLDQLDYPHDVGPDSFLAEVGRRWEETGEVPHEIGLALGYPVKDVLGFMGLNGLPCTGACGWRIYGNPGPSLRSSRRFSDARAKAETLLTSLAGFESTGRAPAPVPARPR